MVGAGAGALSGKLTDIGTHDQFLNDIGEPFQPGSSGLFILVRRVTPDKVLDALKRFEGKVIQTSLTKDKADELDRKSVV